MMLSVDARAARGTSNIYCTTVLLSRRVACERARCCARLRAVSDLRTQALTSLRFGDEALAMKLHEQALEHYQAALDSDARCAEAWVGKARVLRHWGRLGDAEDAYIHAVEASPQLVHAWVELVALEFDGGAPEVAEENLAAALRLHPGHAELVALRTRHAPVVEAGSAADVLAELRAALVAEDMETALAALDFLFVELPEDPLTAVARAEMYLAAGDDDPVDLIHALNRVRSEHPNLWEALSVLGRLMLARSPLRNLRVGAALCEDAWRVSGEHPRAGLALVEAWSAIGKDRLAHALCQRLATGDGVEAAIARTWLEAASSD
jgi:tetratricopeptide (TPR) repeat protein